MGHKDKIRLISLKCRISKIPNSQICAFCRSMSVQSTGDNVVGMPCNEGDPVQGCMMWMDFGFPRIGFCCSHDFAAWLTAAWDFWFLKHDKRRKRGAKFKWQVLAEMNRQSLESSQKKTQSSWFAWCMDSYHSKIFKRGHHVISAFLIFIQSLKTSKEYLEQPCPFLKPHFGGCSFGDGECQRRTRRTPRASSHCSTGSCVSFGSLEARKLGLGDACAVFAWVGCSSILS